MMRVQEVVHVQVVVVGAEWRVVMVFMQPSVELPLSIPIKTARHNKEQV